MPEVTVGTVAVTLTRRLRLTLGDSHGDRCAAELVPGSYSMGLADPATFRIWECCGLVSQWARFVGKHRGYMAC